MKITIVFVLIGLILTGCSSIAPTATVSPTLTPAPIPPTVEQPSPTATAVSLQQQLASEALRPALLNYANAFGSEDPNFTPGAIIARLSDSKALETLIGSDGQQFEILVDSLTGAPLFISIQDKTTREYGQWEITTTKNLAAIVGIDWGTTTTISYAQPWSPESTTIIPIIELGNRFVLDYDLMWFNKDYPDISVRPSQTQFNFNQIDLAVKFAKENNLSLQGNGLLISIPSFLPPWLMAKTDKAEVLQIAKDHITTLVSKYPEIDTWVVAAELENPYAQNFWTKTFGLRDLTWLKESFDAAHAANPNAKLGYSDFDIEFGGTKADRVFQIISNLKHTGTPIDEIAFQMHLNGKDVTDPVIRQQKVAALKAQITRYKAIGIEVILPEMDISMHGVGGSDASRFQLQSQIEYDVILALLESGVKNISHFGGDDKLNWKQSAVNGGGPDALATPFDQNGNPKLNYYEDLKAIIDFLSENH